MLLAAATVVGDAGGAVTTAVVIGGAGGVVGPEVGGTVGAGC